MPSKPKRGTFTLRGGYNSVTMTAEDLQRIDPDYKGKGLEWTTAKPSVSLPATTSEAILAELNSQSGLMAGEATEEE